MSGRFHPHFFARDYAKCVVAKGKCLLDAPTEEYQALFTTVDFSSFGFRTMFDSWIARRPLYWMSSTEYDYNAAFHAPGMGVVKICEQVGLDPAVTRESAAELKVAHPAIRGEDIIMSTDMVVTFKKADGTLERQAFSVKKAEDLDGRVLEKLAIEYAYWARQGIRLSLLLDIYLPQRLVQNMELIMEFAGPERLPCDLAVASAVQAWLFPHLGTNIALRTACARCDRALELPTGTSLSVAYHLALNGTLPLDLTGMPLFGASLNLQAERAAA